MSTLGTLRDARLPSLTWARLVGNGLFRFVYPFLGLVAVDVGLTRASAGLLIGALAVGGMLVPLARGALTAGGERPRRLTVLGLLALALATVLVAAIAPRAGAAGAGVALLGMGVMGVGKPLLDVGSIGYVSERVTYTRRAAATSTMELTWAGGLLLVAPVAGVVAAAASWQVALLALGGVAVATAALTGRTLDDDTPAPAAGQEPRDEGASVDPGVVWRFLVAIALVFVALETTFSVIGLWLEDDFAVDVARLGAFAALTAGGELVGAAFVLALGDRIGPARTATIGLLACAAGFGVLPAASSLPLALAGLAVGLFGTETAIVAGIALASEVAPHARTRFLGWMVAAASVARAVAATAGPLLLVRVGIGVNAAISAAAAMAALVALRSLVGHAPRLAGAARP